MLDTFTIDTFAGRVGETFEIVQADGVRPLRLEAVTAAPGGAFRDRQPFSLFFVGDALTALPQRIYEMRHATLGAFALFLVPVARDSDGARYEAVFT